MQISAEILEGCINNKSLCQEIVYKNYYGFLIAIGNRYLNDNSDVKLMVNETFFKAFTKIHLYNKEILFEIWLRRIMINNCIDYLRKNKKIKFNETSVENINDFGTTSNSINYAELKIEATHLQNLLIQVPETSRKVFCLFAIEGYTHKEIAELLQINEGTSKWHVNNARKVLKNLLEQYNDAQNNINNKIHSINYNI